MKTTTLTKKLSQIISMTVGAFMALSAMQVHADTSLTETSLSKYEQENLKFGSVTKTAVNTGAYQVQEGTGTPFWVYCLDPLTYLSSQNSYTTPTLSSFVSSGYTALFNTAAYQARGVKNQYDDANTTTTTVLNKLTELYSHAYADSLTSVDKSAAFQYAIWEIEGDAVNYSGTSGGLQYLSSATTAFKDQVNTYLTALNTGSWGALSAVTNYIYTVYKSSTLGNSQTVLRVTQAPSNKVPEPSTMLLLGIGILALGASRHAAKATKG